jgi:hypothetical protein
MGRIRTLLFVMAILLSAHFAAAQTGVQLLEDCRVAASEVRPTTASDQQKLAYCVGFLNSTRDILGLWRVSDSNYQVNLRGPVCFPTGLTALEMSKVVVKYLYDNPGRQPLPYTAAAILALSNAYPCR